jgi:transcriptional regulator with XRE-family HTH domain
VIILSGNVTVNSTYRLERAGLNRTEINLLEHDRRVPRLDTIVKLAGAVEVKRRIRARALCRAWRRCP